MSVKDTRFTMFDVNKGEVVANSLRFDAAAAYLATRLEGALADGKRPFTDGPLHRVNYRHLGIPGLEQAGLYVIPDTDGRFLDTSGGEFSDDIYVDMESRHALYESVMTGFAERGVPGANVMPREFWEGRVAIDRPFEYAVYQDETEPKFFRSGEDCLDYLESKLDGLSPAERFAPGVGYGEGMGVPDGMGAIENLGVPGLDRLGIRVAGSEGVHFTSDYGGEYKLYDRLCDRFGKTSVEMASWTHRTYQGYMDDREWGDGRLDIADFEATVHEAISTSSFKNKACGVNEKYVRPGREAHGAANPYTVDAFRESMLNRAVVAEELQAVTPKWRPNVVSGDEPFGLQSYDGEAKLMPVSRFDLDEWQSRQLRGFERALGFSMTGFDPGMREVFDMKAFESWFDGTDSAKLNRVKLSENGLFGAMQCYPPKHPLALETFDGVIAGSIDRTRGMLNREAAAAEVPGARPVAVIGDVKAYTDEFVMSYMAYAATSREFERQLAASPEALQAVYGTEEPETVFADGMFPKDSIPKVRVAADRPELAAACEAIQAAAKSGCLIESDAMDRGREAMDLAMSKSKARQAGRSSHEMDAKYDELSAQSEGAGKAPESPKF